MMSGAGFWAWRRNSGYVIMGALSVDGAAGGRSWGAEDTEGCRVAVGSVGGEASGRSIP